MPLATQGMAAFSCLYMIGCPCHVYKVPTSSLPEAHVFLFSCAQILRSIDGWYEITGSLRRGDYTEKGRKAVFSLESEDGMLA